MENSIAPGFVRINYSVGFTGVAPRRHTMTLPVRYAATEPTPGQEPSILLADNTSQLASAFMSSMVTQIGKMFGTGAEFQSFEYWSKPTPESDPVFLHLDPVTVQPTLTGTNIPFGQAVMTFRTLEGGIFKMYFMEGKTPNTTRDLAPYATGTPARDISNYVTGLSSPVVGRDTSPPIAAISYTGKTNDHLRKKYLLDA